MLTYWLSRQTDAALAGFHQWRRSPLATSVTCLVIGITLALPMVLHIALNNVTRLGNHLKESTTLTIYLKEQAGLPAAQAMARMLQHRPTVRAVQTISPSAGLRELEQQAGIPAATRGLSDNPLPWVIVVTPGNTEHPEKTLTQLKTFLETLPDTDTVQLDTQWLNQLDGLLTTIQHIALSLTCLLGLAVLFITGNTIWTVIRRHSREIQIIRLTGGTARFIRRPFLYAGALYGLTGACLAWLLVTLLINALSAPIYQLAQLYQTPFILTGLSSASLSALLASGTGLGLGGAWLAVTRYLHTSEATAMAEAERKMLE